MQARPLPPRPNLEHYKKDAKDLLKACALANPYAIQEWAERWFDRCAAQSVETEGRLRGVPVTPKLRASVRHQEIERIEKKIQASKLSKPRPVLADAQFFIAREHGFESWPSFAKQIQTIQRANSKEASFEAAADAITSGDIQGLKLLLRDQPELVRMRSLRKHRAPLLHYVAANGIEDFRQKTPNNIVEIAELLLDAGGEVDAESDVYSGGCTALGLVATSVHPERAGVQEALMQILLERGAVIDKPCAAGNRHTVIEGCLANGRARAAQFLASRGVRLNLETAAGAGRADIVKTFFQEDGRLEPTASKQQLQRGFLWACMYGWHEVVEFPGPWCGRSRPSRPWRDRLALGGGRRPRQHRPVIDQTRRSAGRSQPVGRNGSGTCRVGFRQWRPCQRLLVSIRSAVGGWRQGWGWMVGMAGAAERAAWRPRDSSSRSATPVRSGDMNLQQLLGLFSVLIED